MEDFGPEPVVDEAYLNQLQVARTSLEAYCYLFPGAPALMLRFAWCDAATYDVRTKTGGVHALIRNRINRMEDQMFNDPFSTLDMINYQTNRGAYRAVLQASQKCDEVKASCPALTYADIIQLAGIVAVEVAGFPWRIEFEPGRRDSSALPANGVFPARQDVLHGLGTFRRMGLCDKDIVALSGGLALGRREQREWGEADVSNIRGEPTFDNSYFTDLLTAEYQGNPIHPADDDLLLNPNLRRYVELYSETQGEYAFYKDYAEAHKKFSELGFTPKIRTIKTTRWYWPAAVSTAMVALSYFFEFHRRVE